MEEMLHVGYGRKCITPDFPVCLSGYGDEKRRQAKGVVMDIYTTCVAVRSGETTLAIFTNDVISTTKDTTLEIRDRVAQELGTAPECVIVTNIHSHATPRVTLDPNLPGAVEYRAFVIEKMIEAGKQAVADLVPATMSIATKQIPGMTFVRHWLMKDGSYFGPNFGSTEAGFAGHATKADETMILVKFTRQGRQDILMTNWQAHATNARQFGYYNIGPDFIGPLRNKLQEKTGCLVTYLPGASGNQIPVTYWKQEDHRLNWLQYGQTLADHAMELVAQLKPVEGTQIRVTRQFYKARANHADEDKLEQAKEVVKVFHEQDRPAANALAKQYGMTSCYHAMSIMGRPARGEFEELDIGAFRIGNVGFVVSSVEMASTTGIYARQNSPFENTVILCGNFTYVPSYAAYEYMAYEACNTPYAQGTAEELGQRYMEMLHKVHLQ